jgi:hypothetical protein
MLTEPHECRPARDIAPGPEGDAFAEPSSTPHRGAPGGRGSRRVRSVLQTAGLLAPLPQRPDCRPD